MQPVRYLCSNIAGKSRGSPEMFTTSVMRGEILKKKRYKSEGSREYRDANKRIKKTVKKAKEDWKGAQCEEIETSLNKRKKKKKNSKRAYQPEKQGRSVWEMSY